MKIPAMMRTMVGFRDGLGELPGAVEDDRILATVLFTDIVDSTKRAAELGDRQWRALLDRHDQVVREQIAYFRGREVKNLGDGFLATFDAPARATRCAASIARGVRPLGIAIRGGLLHFEDRGYHALRGLPEAVRLYVAVGAA